MSKAAKKEEQKPVTWCEALKAARKGPAKPQPQTQAPAPKK